MPGFFAHVVLAPDLLEELLQRAQKKVLTHLKMFTGVLHLLFIAQVYLNWVVTSSLSISRTC